MKIKPTPTAISTDAGRSPMILRTGRNRGFTLVEAMVALVIGLLLVLVAGAIFVESRQSFRLQDNFAQIQEAGRAVLEDVSREIRKAGSYGCFRWKDGVTGPGALVNAKTTGSAQTTFPIPLNGTVAALDKVFDVRGGPVSSLGTLPASTLPAGVTPLPGSDYIQVMYGQPVANVANAVYGLDPTGTAPITLNKSIPTATGQPFLVADCDAMTLLRTDTSGAVSILTHTSANNTALATNNHAQGSTVMTFQVTAFFVGTDAAGVQSLYRWDIPAGTLQPLVANVDDMQVVFGVDGGTINPAATVSTWLPGESVTAWDRVITVTVNLLIRSNDATAGSSPVSYTWNATNRIFVPAAATDNYVRRPYVINAVIRSRAPIIS